MSHANPSAWSSLLWIALYSEAGHYLNHLLHIETPDSAHVVLSADLLLSACIWSLSRKRDLRMRHSQSFSSGCSLRILCISFRGEKKNWRCPFFFSFFFSSSFLTMKWMEYIMRSGLMVPKTICFMQWIINVSSALKRFSYALQNVIALMVLFNSAVPKVPK